MIDTEIIFFALIYHLILNQSFWICNYQEYEEGLFVKPF